MLWIDSDGRWHLRAPQAPTIDAGARRLLSLSTISPICQRRTFTPAYSTRPST
jgi:hypothetical protein